MTKKKAAEPEPLDEVARDAVKPALRYESVPAEEVGRRYDEPIDLTLNGLDNRERAVQSALIAAACGRTLEDALAAVASLRHEAHVVNVLRPMVDELAFLKLRRAQLTK